MRNVIEKTFTAQIYIAGDLAVARQVCRQHCSAVGLCVTIEPLDFVYTGGAEAGMRVGLINYPRFPATPAEILEKAMILARLLRRELHQQSFLVVTPDVTVWDTTRDSA